MSETVDPKARRMIARAWKDQEYRNTLPTEVREKLPAAPDEASEMTDDQLEAAAGGITPGWVAAGVALGAGGAGFGISEVVD